MTNVKIAQAILISMEMLAKLLGWKKIMTCILVNSTSVEGAYINGFARMHSLLTLPAHLVSLLQTQNTEPTDLE